MDSNDKLVIVILIILLRSNTISAQSDNQFDSTDLVKHHYNASFFSFRSQKGYFPSLVHDLCEQATAPLHFSAKQWLITGAAAGITAGLIVFDDDIDEWAKVQKQNHKWVNRASPIITEFGSNTGLISLAGFGLLNTALGKEKGLQTSLLATQAYITSGIWVQIIKHITCRERPFSAYINSHQEGGHWYKPFTEFDQDFYPKKPGSSFDAFPSGHAATAFSIATIFAMQYRDKLAVPIISYSAATLIGISRLTEHEHWASDVFVGALIGYLCGRQVESNYIKSNQNLPESSKSSKPEIDFFQDGNQVGFSLVW